MKKSVVSLVLALLIICMPIGYSSDALFSKVDVPRVGVEKDSERVSSEGLTRYVRGLNGLVASVKDSEIKYYHSDRIQSNRLVTDSSGSVENEFKSLPFGQKVFNSGVKYAFATGKELDESDLYYFGARYYDSNLGRFTSVDPFPSEPAYQYVNNNPTNMVDSSGRFAIAIPAIGLGEAVILTAAVLTATATLIQTGSAEAAAEKFEETFVEPNKILFENLVNAPKLDATNVVPLILINILTKKGSEEDSTTGPEESSDSNPINKWLDEILEDHKRELGETGTPNGPEEDPDFDPDGSRRSSDEDIPKRLSDEYDLDKAQRGRLRDLMHKQKGPGQNHLPEQTIRELIIDNLLPPS